MIEYNVAIHETTACGDQYLHLCFVLAENEDMAKVAAAKAMAEKGVDLETSAYSVGRITALSCETLGLN